MHNHVPRNVKYTQETLFIRKGRVKINFYDEKKQYLDSAYYVAQKLRSPSFIEDALKNLSEVNTNNKIYFFELNLDIFNNNITNKICSEENDINLNDYEKKVIKKIIGII